MAKNEFGALEERREVLYYHEDFDVFLVTGQALHEVGRRAHIGMKSAHMLTAEQKAVLHAEAQKFDRHESRIDISVDQKRQTVKLYDGFTKTQTEFPVTDLSPELQAKYPAVKAPNYFERKLGM